MYKALGLEGKVVVVTGGAGGIGQATIELMIGRGARVAVADIDMPRAQAVAAPYGGKALAVGMDLTDEASIQRAIARVVEHFGHLDILINNATAVGRQLIAADNAIGEMATETWDTFFDTNCRGTMIVTREALPHLIKSGGGAIVNTVSGMALQGNIRFHAYSATKAALIQMTRAVATAYGRQGVRCNAVAPGLVMTDTVAKDFPAEMLKLVLDETPRGEVGAPQDIAEALAFLASDAARNITGQTLVADGGVSIHIPGFSAYREFFGE